MHEENTTEQGILTVSEKDIPRLSRRDPLISTTSSAPKPELVDMSKYHFDEETGTFFSVNEIADNGNDIDKDIDNANAILKQYCEAHGCMDQYKKLKEHVFDMGAPFDCVHYANDIIRHQNLWNKLLSFLPLECAAFLNFASFGVTIDEFELHRDLFVREEYNYLGPDKIYVFSVEFTKCEKLLKSGISFDEVICKMFASIHVKINCIKTRSPLPDRHYNMSQISLDDSRVARSILNARNIPYVQLGGKIYPFQGPSSFNQPPESDARSWIPSTIVHQYSPNEIESVENYFNMIGFEAVCDLWLQHQENIKALFSVGVEMARNQNDNSLVTRNNIS